MAVDHSLLYQSRKFITAENVHRVNTWIFCYETSEPGSPHQKRYEALLREFVATRNLMLGIRMQAQDERDRARQLCGVSAAFEDEINRILGVNNSAGSMPSMKTTCRRRSRILKNGSRVGQKPTKK